MKHGWDMTGQLAIVFTFDDPQEVLDPIANAERIIQKYLRVADHVSQYYRFCGDRTPKGLDKPGLHPIMQRYYKSYDRLHRAGKSMVEALGIELANFDEVENKYSDAIYAKKPKKEEAKVYRQILDGFGYIQQVFTHDNRTDKRYYTEREVYDPDNCSGYHNGKPIGYWYWLFEDPIAQIPVPVAIINKYIDKYGEAI